MSERDVKTKIVCTIGPASRAPETMAAMIEAGMNVARLNFAHGTFDEHATIIADLRAAALATGRRVAILADLPGPKLRIGRLAEQPVELERGREFTLEVGDFTGDATRASTTFERLPQAVKPGDTIFLNDGLVQLVVKAVQRRRRAMRGRGRRRSAVEQRHQPPRRGSRDRRRSPSAIANASPSHWSTASTRSVSRSCRTPTTSAPCGTRPAASDAQVPVFAKIERAQALRQIDEILAAADGVMVARGDLGVEIPIESIAAAQKQLLAKANRLAKPAITATQMLLSMVENRRPTRAEVTDVANAILDGTDCVMLSEELAIGAYPVEAVRMLSRIAKVTEAHLRARLEPEPAALRCGRPRPRRWWPRASRTWRCACGRPGSWCRRAAARWRAASPAIACRYGSPP